VARKRHKLKPERAARLRARAHKLTASFVNRHLSNRTAQPPQLPAQHDPSQPGDAMASLPLMDVAKGLPPTGSRTVFRPGLGQYIWNLGWSALPIVGGLGTIYLALTPRAQDRSSLIVGGIAVAVVGVFFFAYVLGMRIEVDDETVSKVYFSGLLRRRIPREQLRASSHTERNRWWSFTRIDFESVDDDDVLGFSVYPFWAWRSGDVDRLRAIAAESGIWRAAHSARPARSARPSFTTFIWAVLGSTWLCVWGAIVPVLDLYLNWGGLAAFVAAVLIELGVIVLVVVAVWTKQEPRDEFTRLNTFAATVLGLTALFGILGMVPEIVVLSTWGGVVALVFSGIVELVAILCSAVVTWRLSQSAPTTAVSR
jgi:hypothetical protein